MANLLDDIENVLLPALERVKGANLRHREDQWIASSLLPIFERYAPPRLMLGTGLWHRSRKCTDAEGFHKIQDVLYPPNGSASYGRANRPKQPILYASWNPVIAAEEIMAEAGDYIQSVVLRPTHSKVPSVVVGEIESVANSGSSMVNAQEVARQLSAINAQTPDTFLVSSYIDAFFAERFRERVEHTFQYKLTANFADTFYRSKACVMYPSVQVPHGINIAIPSEMVDADFEILGVSIHRIEKCLGYGLNLLSPIKHSYEIQPDGSIDWNSTQQPNITYSIAGGLRTDQKRGWRKAKS